MDGRPPASDVGWRGMGMGGPTNGPVPSESDLAGLKNYPFEGYAFIGEPPNQSRLWFLEKELWGLIVYGQYTVLRNTKFVGRWSRTCQYIGGEVREVVGPRITGR